MNAVVTPQASWGAALLLGCVLQVLTPRAAPTTAGTVDIADAAPIASSPSVASLRDVERVWWNHTRIDQEFVVTSTWTVQSHWLPKFDYASPRGEHDSIQAQEVGAVEPFPSAHIVQRMARCCAGGGHYADVGSHFGWYAALAASLGCAVDAFEPVPWFAALLEYNLGAGNRFYSTRRVHKGVVVGNTVGEQHTVRVQLKGLLGASGVKTDNSEAEAGKTVDLAVTSTSLDALDMIRPGQAACGLKVDVEGFEPMVLAGAVGYLAEHRPLSVVLEVSPVHAPSVLGDTWREQWLTALRRFEELGYEMHLLQWAVIKGDIEAAMQKPLGEWVGRRTPTGDKVLEHCRQVCVLVLDRKEE